MSDKLTLVRFRAAQRALLSASRELDDVQQRSRQSKEGVLQALDRVDVAIQEMETSALPEVSPLGSRPALLTEVISFIGDMLWRLSGEDHEKAEALKERLLDLG